MKGTLDIVVGLQVGDEGKGKRISTWMKQDRYIGSVRFNGSNNAGHTAEHPHREGTVVHVHILSTAAVYPGKLAIMGPGELIEPLGLLNECLYLDALEINHAGRLIADPRMTVTTLLDRLEDMAIDLAKAKDGKPVGTTAMGIGPTMAGRANRTSLQLNQLLSDQAEVKIRSHLKQELNRIRHTYSLNSQMIRDLLIQLGKKDANRNRDIKEWPKGADWFDYDQRWGCNFNGLDIHQLTESYLETMDELRTRVKFEDVPRLIVKLLSEGKSLLAEGAQGTMLDPIFGAYPYTTSTHPTSGGACVGLGLGPRYFGKVIGVAKAFLSKVGNGPFVTLDKELQRMIQGQPGELSAEFGTTTGRPRDIGWLDLVMIRSGLIWNGCTSLAIMKLDFLDRLKEIKICVAYEIDGVRWEWLPTDPEMLDRAKPIYETLPGWETSTLGISRWEDLPPNAQQYVNRIMKICQEVVPDLKPDCVSTGPFVGQEVRLAA